MKTIEKLNAIFCEVFDDENLLIATEMTANDVEGWDSLSHINLIVAIESEFNIRFSQKELLGLKNIGGMIEIIDSKLP